MIISLSFVIATYIFAHECYIDIGVVPIGKRLQANKLQMEWFASTVFLAVSFSRHLPSRREKKK